jgi:hypothetical protein
MRTLQADRLLGDFNKYKQEKIAAKIKKRVSSKKE